MNMRNFWIMGDIDGYSNYIQGGPKRKDGGGSFSFRQNVNGESVKAFTFNSFGDGKEISTHVYDHRGTMIYSYNSERNGEELRVNDHFVISMINYIDMEYTIAGPMSKKKEKLNGFIYGMRYLGLIDDEQVNELLEYRKEKEKEYKANRELKAV